MLHKTQGIVISFIKYRESSIIVKIYTEKFGLQTYIENGVRSATGKNKIALFQPLTLLDLVVYHDNKKDIHRISELKCLRPFDTIPYEIKKTSICIFINEVLSKCLKEQAENPALFTFLIDAIQYLDSHNEHIENYHIYFLLNFCFYLGFSPESVDDIVDQLLEHGVEVSKDVHYYLSIFIKNDFGASLPLNRTIRSTILESILYFYRIHVEGFEQLRSMAVLHEVLD